MTYKEAEFFPGSGLNVIMGPNGTGKSSLVSAICLALGSNTKVLARADDLSEYIKRDQMDAAFVEVELYKAAANGSNVVISRAFGPGISSMSGAFKMNGKACARKTVQDFVKSCGIHVDNLCVFLAQKRISAFANMKSKELLLSTEEACDPQLKVTHERLIELRKTEKEIEIDMKEKDAKLTQLQEKKASMEDDVKLVQQRQEFLDTIEILEKKKYWVAWAESKDVLKELMEELAEATKKKADEDEKVQPLQAVIDQLTEDSEQSLDKMKSLKKKEDMLNKKRDRIINNLNNMDELANQFQSNLDDAEQDNKRHAKSLGKMQTRIKDITRNLEEMDSTEDIGQTVADLKHERVALMKDHTKLSKQAETKKTAYRKAQQKAKALHNALQEEGGIRSKKLRDLAQSTNEPIDALDNLVQTALEKKMFKQHVFGPVFAEMDVKDNYHAKLIESVVSWKFRSAYMVQNADDYNTLQKLLKKNRLKATIISVNATSGEEVYRQGYSKTQLMAKISKASKDRRRSGAGGADIGGFMDEIVECDDVVMKGLNDTCGLSSICWTSVEVDENKMMPTNANDGPKLFYSPTRGLETKFSRYDKSHRITNIRDLKPAELFKVHDHSRQEQMQGELKKLVNQLDPMKADMEDLVEQVAELASKVRDTGKRIKEMGDPKRARLKNEKLLKELKGGEASIKADMKTMEKTIANTMKEQRSQQGQRLKKLRELRAVVEEWAAVCLQNPGVNLNYKQELAKLNATKQELSVLEVKEKEATREYNTAKKRVDDQEVLKKQLKKTAGRSAPLKEWSEKMREQDEDSTEDIDRRVEELLAQAESMDENKDVREQWARLTVEIEESEVLAQRATKKHVAQQEEIQQSMATWLPKLKGIVDNLNTKFGELYQTMNCRGEVKLEHENDDLETFQLNIYVSYRVDEDVRLLDGKGHSGGEKSVATMLFLLALQKLTDCPFRMVDEINQGMDPNNERTVFDRIVESSSGANTPQYFLITPNLLPNLSYDGNVTLLFTYNGPHQCKQVEWDMEAFIAAGEREPKKRRK